LEEKVVAISKRVGLRGRIRMVLGEKNQARKEGTVVRFPKLSFAGSEDGYYQIAWQRKVQQGRKGKWKVILTLPG